MAKIHGRQTRVYLDGQDISTYFNAADVTHPVDTAETSAFGEDDKTFVAGLRGGNAKLSGFFDNASGTASVDAILTSIEQSSSPILTILRTPVINGKGYAASMVLNGSQRTSPIGGVVTLSADFMASTNSGIDNVRTVNAKGTLTPSVAGGTTETFNGGVATVYGATAYLHAFEVLAGTPVVTIDHSADGATGWTTWATFVAMAGTGSAPQAQKASVSGTIQPFHRTTVTGGSAVVWTGINQPIA